MSHPRVGDRLVGDQLEGRQGEEGLKKESPIGRGHEGAANPLRPVDDGTRADSPLYFISTVPDTTQGLLQNIPSSQQV